MKWRNLSFGSTLIVLAAVLWAIDGVIRRSLFVLEPISIVFFEHLAGSIILLPIVIPLLRKERISRESWGLTILIAALSGVVGTLFFTTALLRVNFIPFSVVLLLQKLQPIFAASSAAVFLKEKITRRYVAWAALALVAGFFVTFPNGQINFDTGAGTIYAALYAVGAAFAWGTSTTFSKLLLKRQSYKLATGLRFFTTTLLAAAAALAMGAQISPIALDVSQISRFAVIAVSTGMVALLIYYRGLQQTQAKISTLLELVFPMLAVGIDAVVYKSVLAPAQYLAIIALVYIIYQVSQLQKTA